MFQTRTPVALAWTRLNRELHTGRVSVTSGEGISVVLNTEGVRP